MTVGRGRLGADVSGQTHREHRPSRRRFDFDGAVVRADDLPDDEEAKAQTGRALFALAKGIEEIGQLLRWNGRTSIPNRDRDVVSLAPRGGQCDFAAAMLDGVGEKVR